MLQMRLMNLGEEHNHVLAQLSSSEQEKRKLQASLLQMTEARDRAVVDNSALQQRQQALEVTLQQRQQELQVQQQQYQQTLDALAAVKEYRDTEQQKLTQLQRDYASLDAKYRKLIRPARSSLGKTVVLVRYHKVGERLQIEMKAPADKAYRTLSNQALHKQLDQLQKADPKKLYVRIIFPDHSGLSYSEAWKLTESLLRRYDYYYQGDDSAHL